MPGSRDAFAAVLLAVLAGAGAVPASAQSTSPGDSFRDCPSCPEMVVVPAGELLMGSPGGEAGRFDNEGPRHRVSIDRAFAVGRYEVTFAEWGACVSAGGCGHRPVDGGWGRGDRPVIHVSWDDAQDYVAWLSGTTGQRYRLPSEAEWEYVARAGTRTRYWWGDSIGRGDANCRLCRNRWVDGQTSPVGSFAANPFGLYDVNGNVGEWVEDCWYGSYSGAPSHARAWTGVRGCPRLLRGGSWRSYPRGVRSASRGTVKPDVRDSAFGFRVARDL